MQIIARAQWGAAYAAGFGPAPLPARELWLHHTATATPPTDASFDQDAGDVRQIERVGQQRFGGGISYTFVVLPSGRVFEGTGPGRQGAHTKGRNSFSRAIVLLGNYDVAPPTNLALAAVAELTRYGHGQGWWPDRLTGGHRDAPGASTACPGRYAYAAIPAINAAALGGTLNPTNGDDVELSDKVHDYYAQGRPDLTVGDALAWAAAHAGQAVDAGRAAAQNAQHAADLVGQQQQAIDGLRADVAALRAQLGAGGLDPQAFADQVSSALARKLAG